jgi:hypothetical protein
VSTCLFIRIYTKYIHITPWNIEYFKIWEHCLLECIYIIKNCPYTSVDAATAAAAARGSEGVVAGEPFFTLLTLLCGT